MRKAGYLIFLILLLGSCGPKERWESQDLHSDHTVFSVNKLAPHADFFAYETEELAAEGKPASSNRFLSLNGYWKFHWTDSPKERVKRFWDTRLNDDNWSTITVPANWEVEGFGKPIYLDERYPFKTRWPNAPSDYNPVGTYRHRFTIPEGWKDQQIILHFAGAKSAMYLYINGKFAGYSQGSKTPAEFEVSEFVKPGENLIAIQMFRWSDASYLESQDMLRMSGIEREVYLYTRPKVAVVDFQVEAGLDSTYRDGIFRLRTAIENQGEQMASLEAHIRLSRGGISVFAENKDIEIPAGGITGLSSETLLKEVESWSAETPQLYYSEHSDHRLIPPREQPVHSEKGRIPKRRDSKCQALDQRKGYCHKRSKPP